MLPNSEFSKSIFVVIGFFVTGKGAAVAGLAIQNGIVVFGLAGISVILWLVVMTSNDFGLAVMTSNDYRPAHVLLSSFY